MCILSEQVAAQFFIHNCSVQYYVSLLIQMSSRISDQPSSPKQVIVHYHYHYYVDPPTTTPPTQTYQSFRRIKSDHKDRPHDLRASNIETESVSSQHSWKKFIKPELQSNHTTAPRSSDTTSFLKPKDTFRKPYSHTALRATVSAFALNTPKNSQKDRSISTKIPTGPEHFKQTGNAQTYFPSRSGESGWQDSIANPELGKSRFCKKRQIQILNANKLKQMTERQLPQSPLTNTDYRYGLLQEQCKYLRQKFLQHIEQKHPQNWQ